MSRYTVKYHKGAQPELQNVIVKIVQGVVIFCNSKGERLDFLEDIDIMSFDDTIPLVVTLIVEGAENVHLQFIDEERKMYYVPAVSTLEQHSKSQGEQRFRKINTILMSSPPH